MLSADGRIQEEMTEKNKKRFLPKYGSTGLFTLPFSVDHVFVDHIKRTFRLFATPPRPRRVLFRQATREHEGLGSA
jgi:hypothetical protein